MPSELRSMASNGPRAGVFGALGAKLLMICCLINTLWIQ